MKRFHVDHTWYEMPSSWNEVPADKVLPALLIIYSQGQTPAGRLKVLALLNPLPAKTYKKLVASQVNELCRLLDWCFETPLESKPFDSFEHAGVVYFLPPEQLQTVTYSEYLTALTYLYHFYYDPEERTAYLTRLIATLCRPGVPGQDPLSVDFTGDYREKFNEHVVEHRARLFLNLDAGIAAGVLQYFTSQLRWLYETYQVFDKPESESEDSANAPAGFDWVEQLLALRNLSYQVADAKLIGNVREVGEAEVNLVFETLEHMKEKQETTPTPAANEPEEEPEN
ncbi:hypothetical protein BWI93_10245 [Siphonobacter sp. BAB-5385]|uniref:hypothetical protein n=1 Tax=Siphonobacter sp. BAB-5385 TaxID=1864822 RepID=UPI000B9DDA82|nr:hypothetical protein [Siphonobacter sp. BAB-5385]OZI08238.1 hypothetical protein BWI93_10245 [Siphonobacter sp. BAB-5385]